MAIHVCFYCFSRVLAWRFMLPDIILLTQCYYYHKGTRLTAMERFCICSLGMIAHNGLTFFPPRLRDAQKV